MQFIKVSKLKQDTYEYNLLKDKNVTNVLFLKFLEQILETTELYDSNYNNTNSSVDKTEHGIICINKETNELQGYLLSRNIGNFRENEIMILCSSSLEILRKMLLKHVKWTAEDRLIDIVTFIPDNVNLINIYERIGFVLVDKLKSRFPTEPDVVKMMYYTER